MLDFGMLLHLMFLNHLLLPVDLLISRVHLDEGFDLGDSDTFSVPI